MKEWFDKFVSWLETLVSDVADAIGLDFWLTAWLGVAAIAVVLIILICIIVACAKSKKKKKALKAANAVKAQESAEEPAPAPAPAPEKAESAPAPAVKEEKSEEKPVAPVAPVSEPAPVVKEEKPAEKPAAKPVKKAAAKPVKKETVAEKPEKTEKSTEKAEKPAKPAATKATEKPAAKTEKAKVLGKWIIERKSDDEYISVLFASNGEAMLTSETYVSEDGARKGVATIVKAVENGDFVIYKNKNGNYYFKLKSAANRLLCAGEIYKDKAGCESAVESVKRIAKDSPVLEEVSDGEKYLEYTPVNLAESDLKSAAKGKWKIETNEDGKFYATLYASNGQVMLSTEEVSAKATALSGIENVKKNALAGNFVIDKDKFGKFYYKLRNANKSVICIGESYPTSARCISALESVRKLAAKSPLVD